MSAWLAGGSLVSIACLSGTAVVSARALGPDGRGQLAVEIVYAGLVLSLLGSGLGLAGRTRLAHPDEPLRLPVFAGLAVSGALVHAIVCGIGGLLVLRVANVQLGWRAAGVLFSYALVAYLAAMSLQSLLAYNLVREQSIVDPIGSAVALASSGVVAARGLDQKEYFLLALTLGAAVQVLLTVRLLRRHGHVIGLERDDREWRALTSRAARGGVHSLTQGVAYRADRYFISLLIRPSAAGIYSVAASVTEVIRLGPWAVGQVLLQRFVSRDPSVAEQRLRVWTMAVTGAIGIVIIAVAGVIVPFVFGEDYREAVTPLRILVVGEVMLASYAIDTSRIVASGSFGVAARISASGAAAVVVLDVALIPTVGITGAAIASVIGYTVMAMAASRVTVR